MDTSSVSQPGCSCDSHLGISFKRKPCTVFGDLIGPYPDEVIMTVLDRILYLAGATKIIRAIATEHFIQPLKAENGKFVSTQPNTHSLWRIFFRKSQGAAQGVWHTSAVMSIEQLHLNLQHFTKNLLNQDLL